MDFGNKQKRFDAMTIPHKFKTDDGSISYRSPIHDEPYHTKAGALSEAIEKHARALKVWEKKNPVIFDVCSGLSYSAACALEEIRNRKNNSFVDIYLFENDLEILKMHKELPDILEFSATSYGDDLNSASTLQNITCFHHFKKAVHQFITKKQTVYEQEDFRITIVFGDVRETIKTTPTKADFVFFAPFSSEKSPELWTKELFADIYSKMHSRAKLSTYAYARFIRDALTSVGFTVTKGPTLGRRSPSIIASKE